MEDNQAFKELLDSLSIEAIKTINGFWDDDYKSFWRSTAHRQREKGKGAIKFFPTVSLKCMESLFDTYAQFPRWFDDKLKDAIIKKYVPRLLELNIQDLKSSLDSELDKSENRLNEFTLSIYIQTIARVILITNIDSEAKKKSKELLNKSIIELQSHPYIQKIVSKEGNEHPFILFHISQALILGSDFVEEGKVRDKTNDILESITVYIRSTINRILAKYQLGSKNPSDSVALCFCSAILSQNDGIENRQFVLASLKAAFEAQDSLGSWPLGRFVHKDKDIESPHLEISTHEISWALSQTSIQLLKRYREDCENQLMDDIYKGLHSGISYIEKSLLRINEDSVVISGWCGDQPYDASIVESWTSANVLKCIIGIIKFDEEITQRKILKTFSTISPSSRDWPSWQKWEEYLKSSEVDHDYPILKYLNENIIVSIKSSPFCLPSAEKRNVSALLFGPPGTSKTTIVKAMAHGLNWPIVLLSPGNFIEGGLESIERISQLVFNRLMKLSQVVVLFDECDELFRERSPSEESEQTRGITAFVTASMLPKLQELHDRGKIVFIICTNNFETIDSAIKRGGRMDHIVGVGPPDKTARKTIVTGILSELKKKNDYQEPNFLNFVVDMIIDRSDRYNRSELQRIVNRVIKKSTLKTEGDAIAFANEILALFEGSLTITKEAYDNFIEQKKNFSHPVIEGGK